MILIIQSDFGGKIPKWIVNKFAPGRVFDYCKDLINGAKQMQTDF